VLTVVHVVGESDTGQTDQRQDRLVARRERLQRWEQQLLVADTAAQATLLCTGQLIDEPQRPHARTPLAAVAASLEAEREDLALVLLGTTASRSVATAPIGAALAAGLARVPTAFGPRVTSMRMLTATTFAEDEIAGLVRDALRDPVRAPGRVVMSWGSASTSLSLAVAAGIVEAGEPLWLRASKTGTDVSLAPPTSVAPLVPWLLRLGYPDQVRALASHGRLHPPPDRDLLDHAASVAERLDRIARGQGGAADLAEWVRADLRRLDETAGMAVRAWIEAEYRARRTADETGIDLLDTVRGDHPGRIITLGGVLNVLQGQRRTATGEVRAALDAPSGRWLLDRETSMLNQEAGDSAHRARPLSPEIIEILGRRLPPEPGPRPAALPELGLPSGEVAVIWTAGVAGHEPYSQTLFSRPAGPVLLRQSGLPADGRPALSCLVLGTAGDGGSLAVARDQAAGVLEGGPHHGAVRGHAVPVEGLSVPAAESAVTAALARHAPDVDAVVVVPIGAKELALGALVAALRHGQSRALPVLLAGTDRDASEPTYHRVVPYLMADRVLTELASRALRRLELGTAARLCAIGSPEVSSVVPELDDLRARLWRPDSRGLRGRLRLCAARLRPAPGVTVREPDRVRLMQIAGELASWTSERGRRPEVARLIQVRHLLVTTHGRPDGQISVAAAISTVTGSMPPPSAPDLIEQAATHCPAYPQDGLINRYRWIENALAEADVGASVRRAVGLDNTPAG